MSGPLPDVLQHKSVPAPAVSWSLIVEQLTGVNDVLHEFVIAVPMHVFPTVLIDPTFVLSQYTSNTP